MKKFIIIISSVVIALNLTAMDNTSDVKKEESKFPGVFNFGINLGGGLDVVQNKINETWYNAPIGCPNGGDYGKILITAGLKIPIKFYSIRVWAKDEMYVIGKTSDGFGPHIRNRIYTGLDNYFSIDKIINIGVNFENRLQAKSSLSPKYPGGNPLDVSSDFEDRVSPWLDLNGSYDFGLSWGITEAFRFYIIPNNEQGKQLDKVQFDGIYFLGFEFMHFTKIENITGQIYTEMGLAVDRYTGDTTKGTKIYWLEYYLGINFNIYGFSPSFGFDMTYDNMDPIADGYMFAGFKAGIGYTKDIYSFSITYIGNSTNNETYYTTYYNSTSPVWENHIEAVFGINL